MDVQGALLQAICDEPDEDIHRLAYADWLDEQGRERRAAFVRAQCAVAGFVQAGKNPFTSALGLDGWHLHAADRDEFLAPLLELGGTFGVAEDAPLAERVCQAYAFLFVRGFVEAITIYGGRAAFRFADLAEEIFAITPLQHLKIESQPFRDCVRFQGYEADPITAITLRRLLQVEGVRRLRSLDLRGHELGVRGYQLLWACPHLSGLRDLWISTVVDQEPPELRDRFGDVLHWVNPMETFLF